MICLRLEMACENFIAQNGLFIAQMGDLSLRQTIYRSQSILYRSNASHIQVNLVRQLPFSGILRPIRSRAEWFCFRFATEKASHHQVDLANETSI